FEEASRLYSQALQLFPDDNTALQRKSEADQSSQNAQAGQSAYYRYMTSGMLAMQSLQYADAVRNFSEALRLAPNGPAAAPRLSAAQWGLAGGVVAQANYYRQLQAGYAAMAAQRSADAVNAFQAAQRLAPNSPLAAAGLRQAQGMRK